MNFLAHLFLSGPDEPIVVGNFLGDFLNNKQVAALPVDFQAGVRLHRQIDGFTDNHPAVRQSVGVLRPVHGRYAPVILDVLHDFLLAKNWHLYASTDLDSFTKSVYSVLMKHLPLMPAFLQTQLPLMVADDWLVRYGTEEGLRFTFDKMKRRSSYPVYFEKAVDSLFVHHDTLDADFNAFFPDVIAAVEGWGIGL